MFKRVCTRTGSALLAMVIVLSAFCMCAPVMADAIGTSDFTYGHFYYYPSTTTFLSSLRLGWNQSSASAAKAYAQADGHTLIDKDVNEGTDGYIGYFGYKTSADIRDAMATWLLCSHAGGSSGAWTVNGAACAFDDAVNSTGGASGISTDLNYEAGGKYIYLVRTTDARAGLPITGALVVNNTSGNSANYVTVKKAGTTSNSDLNEDAGGAYVYIHFDNTSAYTDVTANLLALKAKMDEKTALDAAESTYTASSWAAVSAAYEDAAACWNAYHSNAYQASDFADGSGIDGLTGALDNAINALETLEIDPLAPCIVVSDADAYAGKTIQVTVSLQNNPGIIATRLLIDYDVTVLALTDVTTNGLFTGGTFTCSKEVDDTPYIVLYEDSLSTVNHTESGKLLTLTFVVDEDAPIGSTFVRITCDASSTFDTDLHPVAFDVQNGTVRISQRVKGDASGDGVLDLKDPVLIRRALALWPGVEIDSRCADVDGDGEVSLMDVTLILRYLAGWGVVLK